MGSGTPCILTVPSEMPRLFATLASIPVRTVSGFMSTATDGTLQGLTHVPNPAGVALYVALKWDMLVKRHTHYSSSSRNILKTSKSLRRDTMDGTERQEGEADPSFTGLIRQIMYIDSCDRVIRRCDVKHVDVIDL